MYWAEPRSDAFPARPIIPAMSGADRLVPPTRIQPACDPIPNVSYTANPGFGLATAERSATARMGQCASCCHAGLSNQAEQPLPEPHQAFSSQPVVVLERLVPPTAMVVFHEAGNSAGPKP